MVLRGYEASQAIVASELFRTTLQTGIQKCTLQRSELKCGGIVGPICPAFLPSGTPGKQQKVYISVVYSFEFCLKGAGRSDACPCCVAISVDSYSAASKQSVDVSKRLQWVVWFAGATDIA